MSLADFIKLTDEKLATTHKTPEFDAEKARKPILAAIDKAAEQFGSVDPVKGRKSWSVNRGVVEFSLPVAIEGKGTFYIPSERFPDALKTLKAAIAAGEADAELEKLASGDAPKSSASAGGEVKQRAGWSPERRAKMQAAAEARKAASK